MKTTLLENRFTVSELPTIDLGQIPSLVKISRGPAGSVGVKVTGPDKYRNEVSAEQSGDTVNIRGPRNYSSLTIVSGQGRTVVSNVRSAGTVVISDGRIVIDGRDVTEESRQPANSEPLIFELTIPEGSHLTLRQVGELECPVRIGKVRLNLGGQSKLGMEEVADLSGRISGQSSITIARFVGPRFQLDASGQSEIDVSGFNEAEVDISVSGQGEASLEGNFSAIEANVSGQSKIKTKGVVSGNYEASASGMSSVRHRGSVKGRVSRNADFMSTISID